MSMNQRFQFFLNAIALSSATIALFSCSAPNFSASTVEEAQEEEKTTAITIWSDRFEIFLEHQLIVVGAPVRFISHVTDLLTLEPRREGPLTYVMQHGADAPVEHTEPRVARAGIYIPELIFPKEGLWEITLVIPLEGQDYRVALPPFTAYSSKQAAAEAPAAEAAGGISFLKEQQWKILSRTEPVRRRTLNERLRLSALVSAPPGNTAAVTPPIAGTLLPPAEGVLPSVGDRVEAGQAVAAVQPPLAGSDVLAFISNQNQIQTMRVDLTVKGAEADATAAKSRLELAHAEHVLERTLELFARKAKSAREVEESRFAVRQAKATLDTAESLKKTYADTLATLTTNSAGNDFKDSLPRVELRSPISGTIVEIKGTVGEFVQPDEAIFTVVDTTRVFIEAKVPEVDTGRLAASMGALYETPGAPGVFHDITAENGGRFVFLGPRVDPRTRTVPLVYEVRNPDGTLRLGMAVNVYAQTALVENALALPNSSLVDEDGRSIAYVQVSGETFEKRDLELGIRDGEFVQVLSGLSEGERVVTKGAYSIRLASVSSVIPAHGHAH